MSNNNKSLNVNVAGGFNQIHRHGPYAPASPAIGDIWVKQNPTGPNIPLIYEGQARQWVPIDLETKLATLLDLLGEVDAEKILGDELVERKLRDADPYLRELWENYKILVKLKINDDAC